MTPYYQQDGITIYHGDCREILPRLDRADLLLTDPPYGIKWEKTGFQDQMLVDYEEAAEWDQLPTPETMAVVIASSDKRIIWGGNYFAGMLGPWRGPLVWNKLTYGNPFADGELAWSNIVGTMRLFTHQWCGAAKDSERGERNVHPTQKPVALMSWCINLTKGVRTVIDPFCGSGSTLVAAKLHGLKAVGIEMRESYCEIAAKRLAQGVLFGVQT